VNLRTIHNLGVIHKKVGQLQFQISDSINFDARPTLFRGIKTSMAHRAEESRGLLRGILKDGFILTGPEYS